MPPQIATGSNRVNSAGEFPRAAIGKTSTVIRNIVPAGQTVPFPAAGDSFYVTFASAPLTIKPDTGVANSYVQGTGLNLINPFNQLNITNPGTAAVVFEVFVGFDEYIDNRVIIAQQAVNSYAFATYPTPNAAAAVAINDLSGTQIADINGNKFYAVSREAIYIGNPDPAVTILLQKQGSAVANGPAVLPIYPLTSLRYPAGGNFSLSVGGGNINAIVSEIYYGLPPLTP